MQTFMFEAKMRLSTFHSSVKKEEGELAAERTGIGNTLLVIAFNRHEIKRRLGTIILKQQDKQITVGDNVRVDSGHEVSLKNHFR
jgi:hypothetical protein